jgi:[NiFe] hydrogenase assembly HybE family chaperone
MTSAAETLTARVAVLQAAFAEIARTRMHGVAVLHARVGIEAVDFAITEPDVALGVLVTPWFMNLIRLPLCYLEQARVDQVGQKSHHSAGGLSMEFTIAFEPAVGVFESCSLFSPVTMFQDHAAIVATAREVMRALTQSSPPTPPAAARISRRSMFIGRGNQGLR